MKYIYKGTNQVVDIPDGVKVNTSVFTPVGGGVQQGQGMLPTTNTQEAGVNPIKVNYVKAYKTAKTMSDQKKVAELYKTATGEDLFGKPAGQTPEEDAKIKAAERFISMLEKTYFNDYPESQGLDPLAYGEPGVPFSQYRATAAGLKGKYYMPPETGSKEERLLAYQDLLKSGLAQMAKASGDAANIAVAEQLMQEQSLGKGDMTPSAAYERFKKVREKFGLPESDTLLKVKQQYIDKKQLQPSPTPTTGSPILDKTLSVQPETSQSKRPSIQEALMDLVGSPKARDKFLGDYQKVLSGQSFKNAIGQPNLKIPIIDQLLGLSSGVGKQVGGGPIQAVGGVASKNPYDVAMGSGKTALSLLGAKAPVSLKSSAILSLLGAGGNLLQGKDPFAGAGEGLGSSIQYQALDKYLGPLLKKVIKPRASAGAEMTKEAERLTQGGIKIPIDSKMKKAAQFVLDKNVKGYLPPETERLLKTVASGSEVTPNTMIKIRQNFYDLGRNLSNMPLRSDEGQAFNYIYDSLLQKSKKIAPKIASEITKYAKTFPKPAKEMEPLERLIKTNIRPAAFGAGIGAGSYWLLNKLGLGNRPE